MKKLAVMMRIELNGESLNNEGNVGNVMQPRQIELADGTIRGAISGEMLKHYHSRNLGLLAEQDELCDTCKIFSPMKNAIIKEKDKDLSESGNRIKNCIVDDIEGFMNAGKGRNEKRTSCVKFSWAIATEENDYQSILHSRVDNTQKNNAKKGEDTKSDGNSIDEQNTQMIFYRPIRSNEYAITIQIDADRIGYDDEKLKYAVNEITISNRQKKAIQALKNMFVDMEGSLCSTRLPHITNIEGIVVEKVDKEDVLVKYSALKDDYIEVNSKLATHSKVFRNVEEFCNVMDSLI